MGCDCGAQQIARTIPFLIVKFQSIWISASLHSSSWPQPTLPWVAIEHMAALLAQSAHVNCATPSVNTRLCVLLHHACVGPDGAVLAGLHVSQHATEMLYWHTQGHRSVDPPGTPDSRSWTVERLSSGREQEPAAGRHGEGAGRGDVMVMICCWCPSLGSGAILTSHPLPAGCLCQDCPYKAL